MKSLLVFLFIGLSFVSKATDYFAASANEANEMLKTAKPKDRVILKDGIYTNATIAFTNNDISFIAEHSGAVFFEGNSRLSFAGENNLIEGFVWQNGGKDLESKSVIEFKNGKDLSTKSIVQNCAIVGYNALDLNTDNKWVSIYGTYNIFTHCLLKDKFNKGATLVVWLDGNTEAHHTISYNYFLNRQNGPNADNGLESLRIGTSETSFTPAHCVVAFNRFEKCDGEIEIISNKSWNNSYFHNSFVNNDGGLTLRHGNNCLVDGNFFDGADKNKSYGVRFIGEGHVAINNYFYHLNGAPSQAFRAPLTIVNGLVNTPINGYFQVRRAVVSNNIFVNCIMPNIRVGAFSKRDGMTVAPDTLLIQNNTMFDDAGRAGIVYEALTEPTNTTIKNNILLNRNLSANDAGFDVNKKAKVKLNNKLQLVDEKGDAINLFTDIEKISNYKTVGANWIEPSIANEVKKRKFTILLANEVGPVWMK